MKLTPDKSGNRTSPEISLQELAAELPGAWPATRKSTHYAQLGLVTTRLAAKL